MPRRNNTHRRTLRSLMLNETPPTLDSSRHSKGMNASPKETLSCAVPADFIAARPHHSVAKETVAEGEGGRDIEIFNDRIFYGKNICNMTIFVTRNRRSSKDANYFPK